MQTDTTASRQGGIYWLSPSEDSPEYLAQFAAEVEADDDTETDAGEDVCCDTGVWPACQGNDGREEAPGPAYEPWEI